MMHHAITDKIDDQKCDKPFGEGLGGGGSDSVYENEEYKGRKALPDM